MALQGCGFWTFAGSDSCKATAGDHAKNGNTGSTKEISSESCHSVPTL